MTKHIFSAKCHSRPEATGTTTREKSRPRPPAKPSTKPLCKPSHKAQALPVHTTKPYASPEVFNVSQIYHALPETTWGPYRPNDQVSWASTTTLVAAPPYYISPPPSYHSTSNVNLPVVQNQLLRYQPAPDHRAQTSKCVLMNQAAALCDLISSRMCAVLTAIDGEVFNGDEGDLDLYQDAPPPSKNVRSSQLTSHNYFSKVWLYSNSRLPPSLPPFRVYMSTYPLLCLAAQYSLQLYNRPSSPNPRKSSTTIDDIERYIPPSLRLGTKAMVLKLHPDDTSNTLVLAIRGSQTFMDWAVNFRPSPSSPSGFLDDPGNLVHSGFLAVARAMIVPIVKRLQELVIENPSRRRASLLITGHSAGGAVASLLYMHMTSQSSGGGVMSELKTLAGEFKRLHCVTFGAPPVSLLPLQKREGAKGLEKSLFFGFANEGDPVVRADRGYVKSLVRLYACAPPPEKGREGKEGGERRERWEVPENMLSCAGRLMLLRGGVDGAGAGAGAGAGGGGGGKSKGSGGGIGKVEAFWTSDDQLRGVVFGDPMMHRMEVYKRRVEALAVGAVTAGGFGGGM